MNRYSLITALALLTAAGTLGAQITQYSYISDRRFTAARELMGYSFQPAMMQYVGGDPVEVAPGSYSLALAYKRLYVKGEGVEGVYSLSEIDRTEYGFSVRTMNARDPKIQGHLKILTDEAGHVEGLAFRRSREETEVLFFLRMLDPEVAEREAAYFTNREQGRVGGIDSLWSDVTVRPFFRVYHEMGGMQERVTMADSLYVRFYHVTNVEEKERKVAKLLTRRARRKHEAALAAQAADTVVVDSVALAIAALDTGAVVEVTEEDIAKLLASADPYAVAYAAPDSLAAADSLAVGVDSLLAGADTLSLAADSLSTGADPLAAGVDSLAAVADPPPATEGVPAAVTDPNALLLAADSLAMQDSVALRLDSAAVLVDAEEGIYEIPVKLKTSREYFVEVGYAVPNGNGLHVTTYRVRGLVERVNTKSRPGADRYQWEIDLKKYPSAFVYLDEKMNINSVEMAGEQFFVRGR